MKTLIISSLSHQSKTLARGLFSTNNRTLSYWTGSYQEQENRKSITHSKISVCWSSSEQLFDLVETHSSLLYNESKQSTPVLCHVAHGKWSLSYRNQGSQVPDAQETLEIMWQDMNINQWQLQPTIIFIIVESDQLTVANSGHQLAQDLDFVNLCSFVCFKTVFSLDKILSCALKKTNLITKEVVANIS